MTPYLLVIMRERRGLFKAQFLVFDRGGTGQKLSKLSGPNHKQNAVGVGEADGLHVFDIFLALRAT